MIQTDRKNIFQSLRYQNHNLDGVRSSLLYWKKNGKNTTAGFSYQNSFSNKVVFEEKYQFKISSLDIPIYLIRVYRKGSLKELFLYIFI